MNGGGGGSFEGGGEDGGGIYGDRLGDIESGGGSGSGLQSTSYQNRNLDAAIRSGGSSSSKTLFQSDKSVFFHSNGSGSGIGGGGERSTPILKPDQNKHYLHQSIRRRQSFQFVLLAYLAVLVSFLATVALNLWLYTTLLGSTGGVSGLKPTLASSAFSPERLLSRGSALFGATLDWESKDTPLAFNSRIGGRAGVFSFFIEMNEQIGNVTALKYIIDHILKAPGSALALTVMPKGGLKAIDSGSVAQIVGIARTVNSYGVPLLLRFGHEMNGNWYAWGQQPGAFRKAWIAIATAVRKATPRTYMVWAPNAGLSYPWGGRERASADAAGGKMPPMSAADLALLDTNKNGALDEADDPYTPYYPGDEYVDIIGSSLFSFGRLRGGQPANTAPRANLLDNALMRNTPSAGASAGAQAYSLYDMFSEKRNKPFALVETGAAFYTQTQTTAADAAAAGEREANENDMKSQWMNQVFNATMYAQRPKLRLVMWFDVIKMEDLGLPQPAVGATGSSTSNLVQADYRVTWQDVHLKQLKSRFVKTGKAGVSLL